MAEHTSKLNIIFTGEFTYPDGMAGTKRIQHFIDYLSIENSVKVFLFRQKNNHSKALKIEGKHGKINYTIIGSQLGMTFKTLYLMPVLFFYGFNTLWKWKLKNSKNILYVYIGLTLENIIFVLFAKMIGYRIIVEYVEDFRHYAGNLSKGLAFKNKTNVFFERFLPYITKGIVVISTYLFQKFNKYQKNIPLIHIPISSYVSNDLNQITVFKSPVKIVYSGSFGAKDGLDTLIVAFNIFCKSYSNCELLLSGQTKDLELLKKYCENPKIQYIGYLPDPEFDAFLGQADILCMTRNKMQYANAGFPFKLGAYLATGKPVIATKVSDVELYIENMKDAVLIEPENPQQLIEAFEFLIANPEKAFEIGKNGQRKCIEHFNPLVNGKILNDFLLSIK
jgi:glycosyltransferase involved in cell wall biosynthesis